MDRHTWRACGNGAGFSFVELLVSIVIAGIAFAALVPVFVGATQKNSADTLRVQTTQVAQDKLEKIRQLAYGSITGSNLSSASFADAQFGPSATLTTGQGNRVIRLAYSVTPYPAVTTGLQSEYKVVTVTARWDAPPSPVKPVTLSTIVYRQYAGPPIVDLTTDPAIDQDGVIGDASLTSVLLSAHVDLSAGVTPVKLQFTILGPSPAEQVVLATDTNPIPDGYWYDGNGTFYWRWDATAATNGVYDMFATAYSVDGFVGNTPHLYPRIEHDVPPAPPAGVNALGGDAKVGLSWTSSSAPDLAAYEIFRAESPGGPFDTVLTRLDGVSPALPPTNWTDETVTNGATYFYAVRAVTSAGAVSTLVFSSAVTPVGGTTLGLTAPAAPAATAVPGAPTIRVTWTASEPAANVLQYEIWRSDNGIDWGAAAHDIWVNASTLEYPDYSAGWGVTRHYKVRPIEIGTLAPGPFSTIVSATTAAQPRHDLTISVKAGNNACYVWVLYTVDQHYYSTSGVDRGEEPPQGTLIDKNGFVTFSNLADGSFTVYANAVNAFSVTTNKVYGALLNGADGVLVNVVP